MRKLLIYAEDLQPGETYRYQDRQVQTCDRPVVAQVDDCEHCNGKTVQKLKISHSGGGIIIPNDPKAFVELVHRPWLDSTVPRGEMLVRLGCAAKAAVGDIDTLVGADQNVILRTEARLRHLHGLLEAYFLGLPEDEMPVICHPYPLHHRLAGDPE